MNLIAGIDPGQTGGTINIAIPGEPVPWCAPKMSRWGGEVPTPARERLAAWKSGAQALAYRVMSSNGWEPLSGPIQARVWLFWSPPMSWPKWKRFCAMEGHIAHDKTPDADNSAKAALDAVKGICFGDDCRVTALSINKDWLPWPRVEMQISEVRKVSSAVKTQAEFLAYGFNRASIGDAA